MLLQFFYLLISIILLSLGSYSVVRATIGLASKAGLSNQITGLIIGTFGSSLPGLFVSINIVLSGETNIALGNIIGSNLFNICIILGSSALIVPIKINFQNFKINIAILIVSLIGFVVLFADRHISRFEGIILVSGFLVYAFFIFHDANRKPNNESVVGFRCLKPKVTLKWYWLLSIVFAGIIFLLIGSEILLESASGISKLLGIGNTITGISIVAIATSIPLLVFTIISTLKKENEAVFVYTIGSGIFTLMAITGISAIIKPLSAIAISNIDLMVMVGVSLLLLPFFRSNYTFKRDEGIFMVGIYFIYMYYLWPK